MPKNLEISNLLDFYENLLTENQKQILSFYYNEDFSLSEIAENQGITRQGVRDTIKKAEAQLFDFEKKLQLYKKFIKRKKVLKIIIENSNKLLSVSEKEFYKVKNISNCIKIFAESIYEE